MATFQTITWTNIGLFSGMSYGIYLKVKFHSKYFKIWMPKTCLKITHSNVQPFLLGAFEIAERKKNNFLPHSTMVFLECHCKDDKMWNTKQGLIFVNTLRPRQNGRHFADDSFNRIFVNENIRISIKFSLKFVPKGAINNIPSLVQIMAWRRRGDKPLSETMMVRLSTHICVTRPQWVNTLRSE